MANKIVGLTCIIYQEDCTQEEIEKAMEYFPCCISPLHDKDIYTIETQDHAVGEFKKPHWHVVFSGNLNSKQKGIFLEMCHTRNTTPFQRVFSGEGILKYLTHESQSAIKQGKHIYPKEDIKTSDYFDVDLLKTIGKDDLINKLYNFIFDNNFNEFCDYVQALLKTQDTEFIEFAFTHELKAKHLVDSMRYKKK